MFYVQKWLSVSQSKARGWRPVSFLDQTMYPQHTDIAGGTIGSINARLKELLINLLMKHDDRRTKEVAFRESSKKFITPFAFLVDILKFLAIGLSIFHNSQMCSLKRKTL